MFIKFSSGFNEDIDYLNKILELRREGHTVIEGVDYEIVDDDLELKVLDGDQKRI